MHTLERAERGHSLHISNSMRLRSTVQIYVHRKALELSAPDWRPSTGADPSAPRSQSRALEGDDGDRQTLQLVKDLGKWLTERKAVNLLDS